MVQKRGRLEGGRAGGCLPYIDMKKLNFALVLKEGKSKGCMRRRLEEARKMKIIPVFLPY